MLKIIKSGFSSSARDLFASEISRLTKEGRRACLIVPEQQTVLCEGMMARILPPSATLVFEVTNFTRLANTTFRSLGGLSGEYCNEAKKSLIMWRALTEIAPTLRMTGGRTEINAGLVESALSAVGEMQSLGITPTMLAESADSDRVSADGRLLSKVRDLSSIFALYKTLLSEKYADTGDDGEAMVRRLSENPKFMSDTTIFIDGFTSFTEPQYALIAILSARTDVSVSLTLPKGREDAFEFSELKECQRRLSSAARKHNAKVKLLYEDGVAALKGGAIAEVCPIMWSTIIPPEPIKLGSSEEIRIFEARTPYDECAFICDDIRRRVMEGASYSDFAIVARSADKYDGILDTALSAADIPAFTSVRRDVEEFEAVKLIYTSYSACREFKREDVITYSKCALSGVSRSECDEFETYVNKWQINGRRFTEAAVWNMNPLGYTTRRAPDTDEKLMRIHSIREKIISPLVDFASRTGSATTVRGQAEALLDFLLEIDMESALDERAEMLRKMGEDSLAEENEALWQIICDALDTMVEVLGDCPADADSFLSQLKTVFSSTDIGRIPAFVDRVTVGSADMLRLYEKPYVYLIGVNAGQFPATVSSGSFFSERDRLILSESGLALSPELETRGARELYIFSRAFSYATRGVTLSYSSLDTTFKSIEPSEVISRISKITDGAVSPVKISDMPLIDRIYTPVGALDMIDELGDSYSSVKDALCEAGYEREIRISEGDISNTNMRLGEDILRTINSRPLSLTQTRIDSYVNCPFAFFLKYTIGLEPEEPAELDSRGIGSFIHAVLENFFSALSEEGRKSSELSREERIALTRRAASKYIAALGEDVTGSVRTKIKIDRLCRAALPVVDGLCEEFGASAFEPRFFEMSLSRSDESSPDPISITTDTGVVNIYGIIDRVDAYKRGEDVYLRVVDYKTGRKDFSPEDMADGSNLQMFLYLRSLLECEKEEFKRRLGVGEGGRVIPAGVIYVKTAVGDIRVDSPDDSIAEQAVKDAQHREGMVLDDEDIISAMTLKYTPLYSRRTPDKIPDSKRKFLFSEESLDDIMSTVDSSVSRVADGIRRGEIQAQPNEKSDINPCEYCDFKAVCRK